MLRPLLLSSMLLSSLLACSGGISDVAPAGDEDAGRDVSGDSSTSVDSNLVDSSGGDTEPGDVAVSDGGGVDATPGDGSTVRSCIVVATGASSGCDPSEFCDAPSCTTGTCAPRPTSLTEFGPSCGCDGVTYWNERYAHSIGVSTTKGSTVCAAATAKICDGMTKKGCVASATCIVEVPPTMCTLFTGSGLCWRVPTDATCPSGGKHKDRVCGTTACKSDCEATRAGDKYYQDDSCP